MVGSGRDESSEVLVGDITGDGIGPSYAFGLTGSLGLGVQAAAAQINSKRTMPIWGIRMDLVKYFIWCA